MSAVKFESQEESPSACSVAPHRPAPPAPPALWPLPTHRRFAAGAALGPAPRSIDNAPPRYRSGVPPLTARCLPGTAVRFVLPSPCRRTRNAVTPEPESFHPPVAGPDGRTAPRRRCPPCGLASLVPPWVPPWKRVRLGDGQRDGTSLTPSLTAPTVPATACS